MGLVGLATPALVYLGGKLAGPWGAGAGLAIGMTSGLVSTGIDCVAEITSPSCVIGTIGILGGGFGSSLVKSPRHLSVAAEATGKLLTVVGINADALGGVVSWGEWWKRRNFGMG